MAEHQFMVSVLAGPGAFRAGILLGIGIAAGATIWFAVVGMVDKIIGATSKRIKGRHPGAGRGSE